MTHAKKITGTVLLIGIKKDGKIEVIAQADNLAAILGLTHPDKVDTKKYVTVAPVKEPTFCSNKYKASDSELLFNSTNVKVPVFPPAKVTLVPITVLAACLSSGIESFGFWGEFVIEGIEEVVAVIMVPNASSVYV